MNQQHLPTEELVSIFFSGSQLVDLMQHESPTSPRGVIDAQVAADDFADQLRKRIDARIYEPGAVITAAWNKTCCKDGYTVVWCGRSDEFCCCCCCCCCKQQASITKHGFHEMKRLISQEAGQDGDRMQLGRLM